MSRRSMSVMRDSGTFMPVNEGAYRASTPALTEEIASSVACAVDGSTHMDLGDDHLVPILGFAEGRMRDRLLLPEGGGGSTLHEYVFGISSQLSAEEHA